MLSDYFLPYDRIITTEGIVFEVQSGFKSKDKSLIGRPKFFPKRFHESTIGDVYWCGDDFFKIPVTPELYVLSNHIIKRVNGEYCIPELERVGIREYCDIPLEQIVQHFTPRDKTFLEKNPTNDPEKNAQDLHSLLDAAGLTEVIGIGGSMLMGLSSRYSDIDLVIYGPENTENVIAVLQKEVDIHPRTESEYKMRYDKLSKQFRSFMSFDEYVAQESSKKMRGYVNGVKLTINVVDPENHPSVIRGPFGELAEHFGVIVDDTHSLTHPSRLLLHDSDTNIMTIVSLSRIFSSQVKLGDQCSVQGYLHSDQKTIVVHDSFGGIKRKSI